MEESLTKSQVQGLIDFAAGLATVKCMELGVLGSLMRFCRI